MEDDNYENENFQSNKSNLNKFQNSSIDQESTDANNTKALGDKNVKFDEIPIKPKTTNFLELLEQNLENDQYEYDENYNEPDSSRKIKYQPRIKRQINLNVNAPVKKYKYYSQNFDKNFASDADHLSSQTATISTNLNKDKKHGPMKYEKLKNANNKQNLIKKHGNSSKSNSNQNIKDNQQKTILKVNNFDDVGKDYITTGSSNTYNLKKGKLDSEDGRIWGTESNRDKKIKNKNHTIDDEFDFFNADTLKKSANINEEKNKIPSSTEKKIVSSKINNEVNIDLDNIKKLISEAKNFPNDFVVNKNKKVRDLKKNQIAEKKLEKVEKNNIIENENSSINKKISNPIISSSSTQVKSNPLVDEILKNRKAKQIDKNKNELINKNDSYSDGENQEEIIKPKSNYETRGKDFNKDSIEKSKDIDINYDLPRSVKNTDSEFNYISKNKYNLEYDKRKESNINNLKNSKNLDKNQRNNSDDFCQNSHDKEDELSEQEYYNEGKKSKINKGDNFNNKYDTKNKNNTKYKQDNLVCLDDDEEVYPELMQPEEGQYDEDNFHKNENFNLAKNGSEEDDDDDEREIYKAYNEKLKNQNKQEKMMNNKNYNNYINKNEESNNEEININQQDAQNKKSSLGQSKIINKYFKPIIKENISIPTTPINQNNDLPNLKKFDHQNNSNKIIQQNSNINELLNEKIEELNKEIEKLKKENEKIAKMKSEYERINKKLLRETEEFQMKKDKEQEEFRIWKEEEIKKIEKDRKVYLRNTKLLQNLPNKKEREEIENLKEQNLKLLEEMKAKDQRNKLVTERLKKQLEESNKKNEELNKEIKFMEEMRLKYMGAQKHIGNQQITQTNKNTNQSNNINPDKQQIPQNNIHRNNSKNTLSNPNNQNVNSAPIQKDLNLNNPSSINKNNPNKGKIISKGNNSNIDSENDFEEKLNYNYGNEISSEKNYEDEIKLNYNKNNNNSIINKKTGDNLICYNKSGSKNIINYNNEHDTIEENVTEENDENEDNYFNNKQNINIKNQKMNDILEIKKQIQGKVNSGDDSSNGYENYKPNTQNLNVVTNSTKVNKNNNFMNIKGKDELTKQQNTNTSSIQQRTYEMNVNHLNQNYIPINTPSVGYPIRSQTPGEIKISNQDVNENTLEHKILKNKPDISNEDEEEENYEMEFLEKYHGKAAKNLRLTKQDFTDDGKVIKYFENNKKEIIFPSGVKKEIFGDGYQVTYFNNKDIKQIYPDGKEVYLFSEIQTIQFKFPDGLQVFKFVDGQVEKNYPDGIKHIFYKDGTVKYIYPDQSDETIFPDGTLQKTDTNGIITIDYVDQIKDTIFPDGTKTREYPDGRYKRINPDGSIFNGKR